MIRSEFKLKMCNIYSDEIKETQYRKILYANSYLTCLLRVKLFFLTKSNVALGKFYQVQIRYSKIFDKIHLDIVSLPNFIEIRYRFKYLSSKAL